MKKPTKAQSAIQKANELANKIFGDDERVKELLNTNDYYTCAHLILGARNMFIFFATYSLEKSGKADLAELAQAPKTDYYNKLDNEFLTMCQIPRGARDYTIDSLKVFFKQVANDKTISEITRNQARLYIDLAVGCYDFEKIKLIYDNYMKEFEINQKDKQ